MARRPLRVAEAEEHGVGERADRHGDLLVGRSEVDGPFESINGLVVAALHRQCPSQNGERRRALAGFDRRTSEPLGGGRIEAIDGGERPERRQVGRWRVAQIEHPGGHPQRIQRARIAGGDPSGDGGQDVVTVEAPDVLAYHLAEQRVRHSHDRLAGLIVDLDQLLALELAQHAHRSHRGQRLDIDRVGYRDGCQAPSRRRIELAESPPYEILHPSRGRNHSVKIPVVGIANHGFVDSGRPQELTQEQRIATGDIPQSGRQRNRDRPVEHGRGHRIGAAPVEGTDIDPAQSLILPEGEYGRIAGAAAAGGGQDHRLAAGSQRRHGGE